MCRSVKHVRQFLALTVSGALPIRCRLPLIVLVVGLALAPLQALADVVVPSADVTTGVIVRASASSQSAQIGTLTPG